MHVQNLYQDGEPNIYPQQLIDYMQIINSDALQQLKELSNIRLQKMDRSVQAEYNDDDSQQQVKTRNSKYYHKIQPQPRLIRLNKDVSNYLNGYKKIIPKMLNLCIKSEQYQKVIVQDYILPTLRTLKNSGSRGYYQMAENIISYIQKLRNQPRYSSFFTTLNKYSEYSNYIQLSKPLPQERAIVHQDFLQLFTNDRPIKFIRQQRTPTENKQEVKNNIQNFLEKYEASIYSPLLQKLTDNQEKQLSNYGRIQNKKLICFGLSQQFKAKDYLQKIKKQRFAQQSYVIKYKTQLISTKYKNLTGLSLKQVAVTKNYVERSVINSPEPQNILQKIKILLRKWGLITQVYKLSFSDEQIFKIYFDSSDKQSILKTFTEFQKVNQELSTVDEIKILSMIDWNLMEKIDLN